MAANTTDRIDFATLEAWSEMHIPADGGVPAFEVLEELERLSVALHDFGVAPLRIAVEKLVEEAQPGPVSTPEEDRLVSWAEVGRLVALIDAMRELLRNTLEDVHRIGVLARDELVHVADGRPASGMIPAYDSPSLRRFYGQTMASLERGLAVEGGE